MVCLPTKKLIDEVRFVSRFCRSLTWADGLRPTDGRLLVTPASRCSRAWRGPMRDGIIGLKSPRIVPRWSEVVARDQRPRYPNHACARDSDGDFCQGRILSHGFDKRWAFSRLMLSFPLQNGVGAFILQCKRLDFHYCDWAGSSRGMVYVTQIEPTLKMAMLIISPTGAS